MFGIGFPELLLILALALIVVGPDKLPELARSIAKTLVDLKKTAEGLKDSMNTEDNPLNDIKPTLEDAAKNFKESLLDDDSASWKVPKDLKELNTINRVTEEYTTAGSATDPSPQKKAEDYAEAETAAPPQPPVDSAAPAEENSENTQDNKPDGEKK